MAIGVFSRGMLRIPHLATFLAASVIPGFLGRFSRPVEAVAGWGRKPTSLRAQHYAERHALPYLALEDGFLRSVGLGDQTPPLSVVVDDLGIYYDATRPSRLELLIPQSLSNDEIRRARALVCEWRAGAVSKYNHLREYAGELPERYVLVVDQTFGDASIRFGLAGPESFWRMLQAALDENPDCTALVKIHPDVFAGKKRGYFDVSSLSTMSRVKVLIEDVHPVRLIHKALAIYVVTSQMGFEGLLWGKKVRTFGMPFYAGWGLTQDVMPAPQRRSPATLEQLVHAALIEYPRYVDPGTGKRCEAESILTHIAQQRQMRERFPRVVYALGFSFFKKPVVRAFLQGSEVRFGRCQESIPDGGTLMISGREEIQINRDIRIVRLEDGFVCPVGLGLDLIRPLSLVMDKRGIYFDPTQPSDLEHILDTAKFSEDELERACHVREFMVEHGITKYNLKPREKAKWPAAKGKEVVLVPGQAEDDASIRYGCTDVKTNMDLLQAARRAHPDAFIAYKPHPDVMPDNRVGKLALEQAFADHVEKRFSLVSCIDACDVVHTMTSLAGFDALLRGKRVLVYGQPFYSGWGLTEDVLKESAAFARRQRRLTLDELVAGTLLRYSIYWDWDLKCYTNCETVMHRLVEACSTLEKLHSGFIRRQLRKLAGLALAWLKEA